MNELRESSYFIYQRANDPIRYVRCVEDGTLLCEAKGQVAYLIVGLGLPAQVIKIKQNAYIRVKCKRCATYYNILIQTI